MVIKMLTEINTCKIKKVFQCFAIMAVLSATLCSVKADSGDTVYGPSYHIDIFASCGYDIDSSQWIYGRQFFVEVRDPRGYIIDTRMITNGEYYYVIGTEKGRYTITAYGLRFFDIGIHRYEWHVQKEKTLYVDRVDLCYIVYIEL